MDTFPIDPDYTEEDEMAVEYDWGEEASTFGDRLARAREAVGMDQAQLARRLGVKVATIRNWESDRSEPRANRLQMLTGLLGVSMIWLLTGEGEGGPTEIVPEGTSSAAGDLLAELRALRIAQNRLAERTGQLEKRLRVLLSEGDA